MTLNLTIRQRMYCMGLLRGIRKDTDKELRYLKVLQAVFKKIRIPDNELKLYQISYPAGAMGPGPVTVDNREAIDRWDETHEPVAVELDDTQTGYLKDVVSKFNANLDDLDWWEPLMEQLSSVK